MHYEEQEAQSVNVKVDCAYEGTAFRSYLLDTFDIYLKHGEDGRYLVKNYQSMVHLGLMSWWISACTEIVETGFENRKKPQNKRAKNLRFRNRISKPHAKAIAVSEPQIKTACQSKCGFETANQNRMRIQLRFWMRFLRF